MTIQVELNPIMIVVKISLLQCDHFFLTDVSNMDVLKCNSSIDLIGDYELRVLKWRMVSRW